MRNTINPSFPLSKGQYYTNLELVTYYRTQHSTLSVAFLIVIFTSIN